MVLVDVTINNEFNYEQDYQYLSDVINLTAKHEQVTTAYAEITFVNEEKIQEINREYRHIDKVTDVISFAFEDNQDFQMEDFRFLGEIYICIPRMQEQAREYGHLEKRELAFLTVHGLLHLLGYDHQTPEEEKVMFGIQEEILNEANIKR